MDTTTEETMSTKPDLENALEIPALGRPFTLGMLYNCNTDELVPGIRLWDWDRLSRNIQITQHTGTRYQIVEDDTIREKTNALRVDGELKLSFLANLFTASSSAEYLYDRKPSSRHKRIASTYSCTTQTKELTMSHLAADKIQHRDIFDHQRRVDATHMVTKILYGGCANFILETKGDKVKQRELDTGRLLELATDMYNPHARNTNAKGKSGKSEDESIKSLNVKFYGDFKTKYNPTTYGEACRLFQDIPFLIENNEVPVTVWLYPLYKLDSRACKMERNVSILLISQTEELMEQLQEYEAKCKDIMATEACQFFSNIFKQMKEVKTLLINFKISFIERLSKLLPKIRSGRVAERDLVNLLEKRNLSPFKHENMVQLLKYFDEEVKQLSVYFTFMKDVGIESFEDTITNPGNQYTVSLRHHDSTCQHIINRMKDYMNVEKQNNISANTKDFHLPSFDKLRPSMIQKLNQFNAFYEANKQPDTKSGPSTHFCVGEIESDATECGTFIQFHNYGKILENYKPPGKPMVESKTSTSISLKWEAAETEFDIRKYEIHYDINLPSLFSDKNDIEIEVFDFEPKTSYQFKVRALGDDNEYSLFSEHSRPVHTLPLRIRDGFCPAFYFFMKKLSYVLPVLKLRPYVRNLSFFMSRNFGVFN